MLTSSMLRFRARQLAFAPLVLEMQPHSRRAMAGRERRYTYSRFRSDTAPSLVSVTALAGFPVQQWTRSQPSDSTNRQCRVQRSRRMYGDT